MEQRENAVFYTDSDICSVKKSVACDNQKMRPERRIF